VLLSGESYAGCADTGHDTGHDTGNDTGNDTVAAVTRAALRQLGARPVPPGQPASIILDPAERAGSDLHLAQSGLLGLLDPGDRPVVAGTPDVGAAAQGLADALSAVGARAPRDGAVLLTERAVLTGLRFGSGRSMGGGARLVPAREGWVAIGLRRPDDYELLPALTGRPGARSWDDLIDWIAAQPAPAVVERAQLLGLPAARPGSLGPESAPSPWVLTPAGELRGDHEPLVLDLSSLWAGPLAAGLLADAGYRVLKVETPGRLDGARRGNAEFFDLLNAGKGSVVLEPDDPVLAALFERATVVLTSARPRALAQLGWWPRAGQTWVTITGYGWSGPQSDWVGYGDEAAVAAGLIWGTAVRPQFCADAVADPLTGLAAALAVVASLRSGRAAHVDLSLAAVARFVAATAGSIGDLPAWTAPPRARRPLRIAAAPGADNDHIASWL
jgi:hypothetical protein